MILPSTKILVLDENTGNPVPVPIEKTTGSIGITANMFNTPTDLTPLSRFAKRMVMAINTVMKGEGFAYWGNSEIEEDFFQPPANGFSFVFHRWPRDVYANTFTIASSATANIDYDLQDFYYDIKMVPDNTGLYELESRNGRSTASTTDEPVISYFPNTMWWTNQSNQGKIQFRNRQRYSLQTETGAEIIGAVPYENFIIVFTDSEIWKVQVNETIEPLVERLQSTVGAVSRGNIVATEQGVFFLARDGIYFTDGNTVQQCNRIKRKFKHTF